MRISEAVLEFSALASVLYLGRNPRNFGFSCLLKWIQFLHFYRNFKSFPKLQRYLMNLINKLLFFLQIFLICLLVYLYAMMMSLNHGNSFEYNKWCLFGQDGILFLLLMDLFELMIQHYLHLCMDGCRCMKWLVPHEFAIWLHWYQVINSLWFIVFKW